MDTRSTSVALVAALAFVLALTGCASPLVLHCHDGVTPASIPPGTPYGVSVPKSVILAGVKELRVECSENGASVELMFLVPPRVFGRTYNTAFLASSFEEHLAKCLAREFGAPPIPCSREDGGKGRALYSYVCPSGHSREDTYYLLLELWDGGKFVADSLTEIPAGS